MKRTILVIDDDPMIHKLVDFSLKDEGYSVTSKFNGKDAKTFVEENYKDLSALILDWEMPEMSGLELLDWLKKNDKYKDIPVVMLTGHTERENIQKGIDSGAYYYLTKPFRKELLQSIIRAAINDYLILINLNKQVQEAQNPFNNLVEGTFKIKTLGEAQKLSVYLANASESPEETLIICELFNNAIEHGNLGITYEEKSELIDNASLEIEIEKRLALPEHRNKFATVKFSHDDGHFNVLIEDQGKGFDFTKYLQFDESRVFDNHGRGIAMANTVLDISYLGKGNKVQVKIPLSSY